MKKKVIALLQARTDSTRLPAKVLLNILDKPMIIHQLQRTSKSKYIDELILLTSNESSDDELVGIVRLSGFSVFRGSKDNVLERFYKCLQDLKLNPGDIIVRLTGDCPIHDAKIVDELINAFLESDFDYMANCVNPIYPDGFDTEVFTFEALQKAYFGAKKLSEKEHVTPYIRESGLFRIANLEGEAIHPEWRLTVDEPADFIVIEKIYNYFNSNDFSFADVIIYIENNPSIMEINSRIIRNEGYLKSLEKDKEKVITNRLVLKPLLEDFLSEQYFTWMNDTDVLKYTESRWSKHTIDDLQLFVKNVNQSSKDYLFGIFLVQNNKHIGNIKIGNINFLHKFADLGIIIGTKEEWGKGYATEALRLAVEYAFVQLKLFKITAGAYANNFGSIKALQKAGFKQCGKHIQHCMYNEKRVDVLLFEIINNEIINNV